MSRRSNGKSPIQKGSDSVFDVVCSPCGEAGLQEEALKYCPECQEYLCTACTKCHQRMRATREHKLTGAQQAKQNPVVVKKESTEKCWYHPDRNVEMYCRTHDMVYCARCIATEHRSCSGVTEIDRATQGNNNHTELQRLLTETADVYEQLVAIKKKRETDLETAKDQQTKILDRIKELERDMVKHIEKLGREATDSLKEKYTEVKNELESGLSRVNQMIGKMKERKRKLEEAVCLDDGEKFIQVKLGKKAKDDALKLYKESESESSKVIQFTENKQLSDSVVKTQSYGEVTSVKVEQQKKMPIRTACVDTDDESCCLIADLCQLGDGRIILVDQRNRKLKSLDEEYRVDSFWCVNDEPTGICCLGRNEIAVKYRSNKVEFSYVTDTDLLISRDPIWIEDGGSWGLTYFAGELWTSFRFGVRVYSLDGELKDEIGCCDFHTRGEIFNPVHLSAYKGSIFITNGGCGVMCFDRNRFVKDELHDERLGSTRGVCVTSRKTVFVSGFQSDNVVMFDKDGKCLGEIVTEEMMPIKGPGALLFDYRKNCLLVTCSNSDHIIVVDDKL